jgi:hypothetical protein
VILRALTKSGMTMIEFARLAAAQCGKPVAFRVLLAYFLRLSLRENYKARSGKAKPFRTVLRQAAKANLLTAL